MYACSIQFNFWYTITFERIVRFWWNLSLTYTTWLILIYSLWQGGQAHKANVADPETQALFKALQWDPASLLFRYSARFQDWHDDRLDAAYTCIHALLVFIIPCLTVVICHHAVGHQLYVTSLKAAAASGEIPLPMPILPSRPKEMIVIASIHPPKVRR